MPTLQFIPGYYAKIRIDDEGKIVDVADLEPNDLPQHSHALSDILNIDDLVDQKIRQTLQTFFVNNGDTAVKFVYDEETKTITADVDLDEETIVKNEYGQLAASVDFGNTSVVPSIDVSQVEQHIQSLENRLPDLFKTYLSTIFANSAETAVDFRWDPETGTVSADVDIDGISIDRDEYGNLVATGAVVGSGETGNCASHTHLTSQIEDFEEAVVNIFNDYSRTLSIDFQNYIDGVTIKINQYGQLTAVRTALEKHTHVLADIIDYEAAEAAAKQAMSALGTEIDLSDGVIDFTNLNIGYSILALNKYLQDVVNSNISNLIRRVNQLHIVRDNNGQAILSIHKASLKNLLLDLRSNRIQEVYLKSKLSLTLDFLPYDSGEIQLLQNGRIVARTSISYLQPTIGSSSEIFTVENVYMKNAYRVRILNINIQDFLEGEGNCEFQIRFVTEEGEEDHSNTIQVYYTSFSRHDYEFTDITDSHDLLDESFYDLKGLYKYRITLTNYRQFRFINPYAGFDSIGNLTGVSESAEKLITIPDLFENATVHLLFEKQYENSICPLRRNILSLENGEVINDVLTAKYPSIDYVVTFSIPNSELYNSVQFNVADSQFETQEVTVIKGSNRINGNVVATEESAGVIKLSDTGYLFTFGNVYDNGKTPAKFILKSRKSFNLNDFQFTPCNFF